MDTKRQGGENEGERGTKEVGVRQSSMSRKFAPPCVIRLNLHPQFLATRNTGQYLSVINLQLYDLKFQIRSS